MKKILKKAHKFRLKPNQKQRELFAQYAGSARFVYNRALHDIKRALDAGLKIPTYNDAAKKLPLMKASEETAFLKDVHSQVLQQSLKNLYLGLSRFYKQRGKNSPVGFPRFKKKGKKDSCKFPQNVTCENGRVLLPRIGSVLYRDSRPVEGKIKQAVIKKEGDHWYITLFTEIEIDIVEVAIIDDEAIGIDAGVSWLLTTSRGDKIEHPAYLRKQLKKLAHLYRELSRKKKFSNNWKKCVRKIQRLHIQIKNQRNDYLHKVSTLLSKNHGVVCVEDLNIKGMVKNRRLSRSISDAGWGILFSFLAYKTEWLEKHFVKIDRWFASSQLCSTCGNKQDMALHKRIFRCDCGLELDRDVNAALNIRMAGLSILKACGENDVGQLGEARITGLKAGEGQFSILLS